MVEVEVHDGTTIEDGQDGTEIGDIQTDIILITIILMFHQ